MQKTQLRYVASSEDVCPLAILLYAQGVAVPDIPYPPAQVASHRDAADLRKKSIMDKYLDILAEYALLSS